MPQTIGIVGGLSPESTVTYYQFIVRQHFKFYGDLYYPRIVIASVCYQQYADWHRNGQWDVMAKNLEFEFTALAKAGADFALIACNTVHKALPLVKSPIPILNIIDVAVTQAQDLAIKTLVLTGSKFTMTDEFLSQRLQTQGINVLVPNKAGKTEIDRIICTELIKGITTSSSATGFAQVVQATIEQEHPAQINNYGVLLACTELGMLLPYLPPPKYAFWTPLVYMQSLPGKLQPSK
ncbi:MAG: amino acid racemase [Cyanobacteria bacterium J06642_3]